VNGEMSFRSLMPLRNNQLLDIKATTLLQTIFMASIRPLEKCLGAVGPMWRKKRRSSQ